MMEVMGSLLGHCCCGLVWDQGVGGVVGGNGMVRDTGGSQHSELLFNEC